MVRFHGEIYNAVAQLVLLYRIKSWLVMGEIIKFLEGFRHQVAQRITGMTDKCGSGEDWEYPVVV